MPLHVLAPQTTQQLLSLVSPRVSLASKSQLEQKIQNTDTDGGDLGKPAAGERPWAPTTEEVEGTGEQVLDYSMEYHA